MGQEAKRDQESNQPKSEKHSRDHRDHRDHEKDLERLAKFRPMDDTFMRAMLAENVPLAQFVLRTVMRKSDLVITDFKTQADMRRVTGARSVCLDAYGKDSAGKKYDLEIEKSEKRADGHRARYHSSVMDVENLDAGQDFTELPDVYVIFLTEKDLFGDGASAHSFQNRDDATGNPLGDGSHILYVNGEYRGDDELGKLMHDFNCNDAGDMYFPLMAEQMRYLKENPKGVRQMCKIMDDLRKESEERGEERGKETQARETAKNLYDMGLGVDKIVQAVSYPVEVVKQWLGLATVCN